MFFANLNHLDASRELAPDDAQQGFEPADRSTIGDVVTLQISVDHERQAANRATVAPSKPSAKVPGEVYMRLFSLGLAASFAASVIAAEVPPVIPFAPSPNRQAPEVCSIPLLSPKPPLRSTPPADAKILRIPPSNTLDHNQIPPPAPPCGRRSAFQPVFPAPKDGHFEPRK